MSLHKLLPFINGSYCTKCISFLNQVRRELLELQSSDVANILDGVKLASHFARTVGGDCERLLEGDDRGRWVRFRFLGDSTDPWDERDEISCVAFFGRRPDLQGLDPRHIIFDGERTVQNFSNSITCRERRARNTGHVNLHNVQRKQGICPTSAPPCKIIKLVQPL